MEYLTMKLTEARIKQIIKEEIDKAAQDQQQKPDDSEGSKSLSDFQKFLVNLAKSAPKIKGASPTEIQAAAALIKKILSSMDSGEIAKYIQYADDQFSKKAGIK